MKKIDILYIFLSVGSFLTCFLILLFFLQQKDIYADIQAQKSLYENEKYLSLVETFSGSLHPAVLHNVGNAYAQLAKNASDSIHRENFLQKSLESYEKSLEISENSQTRKNYEYIKSLLDSENTKESSKDDTQESDSKTESSRNDQESSDSGETSQSGSENASSQETSQEAHEENSSLGNEEKSGSGQNDEKKSSSKTSSGENLENEATSSGNLSQEDQKKLEQYSQQIQNMQKNYQQFYGNSQDDFGDFSHMMDSFFGNINRGGEKTW